jgi:mono/diheme cytochrome c family protein
MLISRLLRALVVLFIVIAIAGWWITRPQTISATDLPEHRADPEAGERIFWAGGCASCHASPVNGRRAKGDDKLLLGGGLELDTPYGVFRVPNISPHVDDGIGGWTLLDFVNAMQRGVSPDGRHYYPSFPYTSYARVPLEDVIDLKAFIDTLPPVNGRIEAHSLGFPWSVRRGIGAWKRRYLVTESMARGESPTLIERGRLLVEGAGHCGECHTPRDRFGGLLRERWLAGAPNPEGKGRVPNITPGGKTISEWSAADIAYYLESGFTPDFDTVGGSMVAVQENMAKLDSEDREAIAAYLKALPAIH